MPRLIVQSEEQAGQIFDLSGESARIGRINENEIVIQHKSISSHHAELVLDGNDYLIKDLDSTNGTRVNGERVKSVKLRKNDLIRVGNIELIYESEFEPDVKPLPERNAGVNLAGAGFKGLPAHFKNASLIPKQAEESAASKSVPVLVSWVLLIGAAGFFVVRVFF
ncbi:MAG: FHA domain-containing protein [Verrucomicrobiota bacterium]